MTADMLLFLKLRVALASWGHYVYILGYPLCHSYVLR